jgi:hypothetical protein
MSFMHRQLILLLIARHLWGGGLSRNSREWQSFMAAVIAPLLSFDDLDFVYPIIQELIVDSIQSAVINDRSHLHSSFIHCCPHHSSQ